MKPTRILHLEDSLPDAELAAALLLRDGVPAEVVRVDTKAAFLRELDEHDFDVILADYNLPQFDGIAAQRLAAERRPTIPFIFLSGTLGEEIAIERIKAGATDYVLKQRMERLPSAVRRALDERRTREERQAAIDAKMVLEDLIAASPSMIFRLHPSDLRILYASPNVGWILGYSSEEIYQKGWWDSLLHEEDHDRVIRQIEQALVDHVVQIEQEYRLRRKDGRYQWFFSLMRVEYSVDGRPVTMLRYCLDIGDRKAAELEADRANRAKSEFLSRMSHDLRTPLNAVLGFAQVLADDGLTSEQRDSVQQIVRAGRHLLQLINEVLDIARIEAGHLSISSEPVAVNEVVQHALELIGPLAAARDITVALEGVAESGLGVRADRQRLNQVLLNLLSNAVKYNRHGGRVTVRVERRSPSRLRIYVIDTGAGILPEHLDLLFMPFERLGAEATEVEGTGLGLMISRGLAEAMGGELGVESEVGRGSAFWIELDVTELANDEAPTAAPPPAMTIQTAATGTVLYIEDNTANVRLMERVFKRRPGLTLEHAGTGAEGIAKAHRRPTVIFLDLHLPDQHGEQVLMQLRADPALRAIPVVVLSADATATQERRLKAAGAAEYLTKPLNVEQVLRVVDELTAGR